MKSQHRIVIAIAILLVASLVGGYYRLNRAVDEPQAVAVTAILNTSGRLSSIGEPTRRLLDVFEHCYNDAHPEERIKIRYENAASDASRAADAITKALSRDPPPRLLL